MGWSKSTEPWKRKWFTFRAMEGEPSWTFVLSVRGTNPAEALPPCRCDEWRSLVFSSHRSSLQTSAPRLRVATGTWSTSAALSARPCWEASATSWRRDDRTAVPALSPSTPSTATPVGSISVCCQASVTANPHSIIQHHARLTWINLILLEMCGGI